MRRGQNPAKAFQATVQPPAEITVGVLNYIPDRNGYFEHAFEVLKLCLASIRANADRTFDLLVVDNGSCAEVRTYLQGELTANRIQYLILNSSNIGKANAMVQIMQGSPGDYIFYTDGDIFFLPKWMSAHLAIYEAYPNVGLVGGIPLRNIANFYTTGTLRWVEDNRVHLDACETGHLIPDHWVRDFLHSVGNDDMFENWQHLQETRIVYHEVPAYVGGSHMQFLISREAIGVLPRRRFGMALQTDEDQVFDRALEDAGKLRLSAPSPFVYHIGNTLSEPWLHEEYSKLVGTALVPPLQSPDAKSKHWFWSRWSVRRVLRQIYEWSFKQYYRNG